MGGALAMAAALVISQLRVVCEAVLRSVLLAERHFIGRKDETGTGSWEDGTDHAMYERVVFHERRHPVHHFFEYKVRYAFVNLDKSPSWFAASSAHPMIADQARSLVDTSCVCLQALATSRILLSVYYCYEDSGLHGLSLTKTIAEVTNTPWGERVAFSFDAKGDTVAKPLHVSPFMDMHGAWRMRASIPEENLSLTIEVENPDLGNFFVAALQAKRVNQSLERFLWLMPHQVAVWIYRQALVLLWKGVAFVQHPKYVNGDLYRERAQDRGQAGYGGDAEAMCPRLFK